VPVNDGGGLLPLALFLFKLLPAGAGQLVVLGFAIVLRHAPFGADVAFLFQLEKRGIERSVIDGEQAAAGLLDAAGDSVAVKRPDGIQGLERHEGQRALPDIGFFAHNLLLESHSTANPMGMQ